MKKFLYVASFIVLLALTFLAGYWYNHKTSQDDAASGERKILYYVDPMNPGHRYEKPGVAPCGMALEPVYADGKNNAPGITSLPGTIQVSPEKQQLIGVRIEPVEKASGTHTVRLLGRVAADETRIYRIRAYTDGWIRKVFPVTTGTLVKKNQPLAYFYAAELLLAQQAYISILASTGKTQLTGKQYTDASKYQQFSPLGTSVDKYRDSLRNLGMSDIQIEEIGQTKVITQDIVIRSPASGFVLARNISPDERFEKGAELFTIGDLRKVWILLDTYENEAKYFRPGDKVSFRYQGRPFQARVSNVLPVFDPATRTLKVRLEADNPGFVLRPDMFVDVEHSVTMPPAVTVPADAVLDTGLKKTVFVERDTGLFEAREVETGRHLDNRVEILEGLKPGERIVVSGNFLIDSESRMKSTTEGMSGTGSIDPACRMIVDQGRSRAAGLTSEYQGKTYYFCSTECKRDFDKTPLKFTGKQGEDGSLRKPMENGGHRHD